jgi:hypothetical protein
MTTYRVQIEDVQAENPSDPAGVDTSVTAHAHDSAGNATGHRVQISTIEVTVDPSTVKPFASLEEMTNARFATLPDGSMRIFTDPAYRAEVEARMGVSMAWDQTATPTPIFVGGIGTPTASVQHAQLTIPTHASQQAGSGEGFSSVAQMVAAMSDPRYRSSEAYRNAVDAKVGNSNL